ncbi:glycosyltransferase family 4 protein, partial [Thermoanaerobacterium thermosaccharolyticum]|uniref:glycosyltransferase family 4 protein n=1 Tax=Thermoanaerobacterium thermosaccharolyticum TaxID=1517 RepID=UPI00177DCF58
YSINGIDWTKYVVLSEERKKELRKRYNIINNEKVICLLGRLAPVKGHLFLLDALYDIKKHGKFKNYKILFTGNGSENYKNEIIKKAESYGLINNIIFTGYVNPAEILNISDLLVLPSENEGFPIVCIEAFALKVPVIRTKTGGYSDMKDQCIGVEYGDIAGLSNAITEVFLNSDKTLEMVNKAYKLYQDRLTSNKMVEAILEVYKDSMR